MKRNLHELALSLKGADEETVKTAAIESLKERGWKETDWDFEDKVNNLIIKVSEYQK